MRAFLLIDGYATDDTAGCMESLIIRVHLWLYSIDLRHVCIKIIKENSYISKITYRKYYFSR